MKVSTAKRATTSTYELAESPVWDTDGGVLHWVDIPVGAVMHGHLRGDKIIETGRTLLTGTVGAVALARDGGLLVAAERGLATIDPLGTIHRGPPLLPNGRDSRLNDGVCDPAGRFLVGSLARGDRVADEVLLQVEPSGSVRVLRSDVELSNGIVWSPSGDTIYHVDTSPGIVWTADYDVGTGHVGSWRVLFKVDDGLPDGMTVDEDGLLWIAIWGRGQVRRYDPTGVLHAVVSVDAPQTSCVTFVGSNLDTLAITTARDELSSDELARYPSSGALFLVRTGVRGLPEHHWSGDTSAPAWEHV